MEELKKFSSDIICLQEVDHYEDFYRAELSYLGYDLVYQQKNKRKDGCVIGVKKELFERISTKTMDLDKGHKYEHKSEFIRGNIVLIATYRHVRFWDLLFCSKIYRNQVAKSSMLSIPTSSGIPSLNTLNICKCQKSKNS